MIVQNVGLQSIAERLNISISTVSRALRDAEGIHPATRSKIVEQARALGYVPQKRKRTVAVNGGSPGRSILVLTGGQVTPGGYMEGLSEEASRHGVTLQVHHCPHDRCATVLEGANAPVALRENSCDGVILIYHWPEKVVEALCRQVPVVSIMHDYPGHAVDMVGVDELGGASQMFRHLGAMGHSQIGFYGLMPQIAWSRARFGAYMEAAVAARQSLDLQWVVEVEFAPTQWESFRYKLDEAVDRVLRGVKNGVRAWVAADEFIGYCLCEALLARGLSVPGDVSVAGFHHQDYQRPTANVPTLASTRVNDALLGRMALKQMLARLEGDGEGPLSLLVPTEFLPGESTAS